MKIETYDGSQERSVLIGMIVSSRALGRIAPHWHGKPMRSRYSNIIGQWCVEYWNKYNKAPNKSIKNLYRAWARRADKDTISLVDKFLSGLSGEYSRLRKGLNPDEVVDTAGELFERIKQERLVKDLTAFHTKGDLKSAALAITKYEKPSVGTTVAVRLLKDMAAMKSAFVNRSKPIITYPDGLGNFYGDALERDGFISFMGMEKVGKTWLLIDMAWQAMMQGRKVAFFEVGDLSQDQILRRFGVRASKIPLRPGKIIVPTYLEMDNGEISTSPRFKKFKQGIRPSEATESLKTLARSLGRDDLVNISAHPNDSISAAQIENILAEWKRLGWTPDVVVIDYADILAPMDGRQESRDQINSTWKRLRRISQQGHCLVVTATQANALAYKADKLDKSHFSEDKRKFAHTTGMIGISQNNEDKRKGVTRLSWLVLRESHFDITKECYVAGCLELGNPCMYSIFGK